METPCRKMQRLADREEETPPRIERACSALLAQEDDAIAAMEVLVVGS